MNKEKYKFGRNVYRHRVLFVSYLLCVPAAAVASVLFSLCLQPLVDVTYSQDMTAFQRACALCVVCLLFDVTTHYFHKIIREKMRVHFMTGLKRDLFNAILKKDIKSFHTSTHAQYMSVINRDVTKMNEMYYDAWCGIYRVAVNFLMCFVLIILINPWIALFNLAIGAVSAWIPHLFEEKLMEKQEKASAESETNYNLLSNYLRGFTTIRLFRMKDFIEEKMEGSTKSLERANYDSTVFNYSVTWVSQLLTQFGYIFTIAAGVFLSVKGLLTIGTVVAVSQLIGGILIPFEELPEHITNLRSISVIKAKIEEYITKPSSTKPGERPVEGSGADIVFSEVAFSYEDKAVFSDINLQMSDKKKYILIGKSGSGKTTLANLIMGFEQCTDGTVTLNGTDIAQYDESSFYQTVACLEQDVFLFDDTIYNNITLFSTYDETQIHQVLKQAGLTQMIDKLPLGLETVISGNGDNVSGGERQRIGIARALLTGARFLILDEITTGLDPVQQAEIEDTVMSLQNTGVLMITHNWAEELLSRADGLLYLHDQTVSWCDSLQKLREVYFS